VASSKAATKPGTSDAAAVRSDATAAPHPWGPTQATSSANCNIMRPTLCPCSDAVTGAAAVRVPRVWAREVFGEALGRRSSRTHEGASSYERGGMRPY
jgi:hypothetical protein